MQLIEPEDAPSQLVVAEKRREILPDGCDQRVVDRERDVVLEERSLQRGGIISRPRAEDVRLDRIRKRGREGELVILKLGVVLVKGALPQFVVTFDEKRADRSFG